jgi:hypothetical protein
MTLAGGSGVARAATAIWGGGTGTWGTAANWLGGVAPGASDTASFTGWVPMARSAWTVTASTGAAPSNAKDGSWNTRWTTGAPALSGQWFKIDLGSTQTFSRIVLDDTGDGSDYPPGYDVYVSSDGSSWGTSIASGTGAVLTTINFTAQSARYVKVQLNAGGSSWWSMREIFVYTTGLTDDTQLARNGWTVSASLNSGNAVLAIDTPLSTRWDTGTTAAAGQWFKIDLGAPATIDRVDFSSYTDPNDYPPSYTVQLSTDDVTYGASVATGTGSAAFTRTNFTAQTARYVLLTCTGAGSNYWSIHDLNVYGTPRSATLASSASIAGLTLAKSAVTQGAGAALTLSGAYSQSAGTFTGGDSAFSVGGTSAFSGGTFSAGAGNVTLTGAVTVSGGTVTLGSGTEALQSTLSVTGGTFTAGSGAVTVTGAATVSGAATINAATSTNFTFGSTLAIGSGTAGTFNANSATVTFTGAATLQNGGAFNGNTGSGTFSAAPILTSGTFTVGDAGSTGRWTLTQSTTFSSGVTLAFPTDKGELSLSPTKVLTVNGPVTSNVGTASTLPKIDCNGCTAAQGITVAFGATSSFNLNGLEFDDSVGAGVSIANGATYTLLKRLKFRNNRGGAGSTHLSITLGTGVLNVPGCYFDATALHNVTLYGAAAAPAGARAILEYQSATVNGSGAGASLDQDGDSNGDNVGDNTSTGPYYGSVVEWVNASATDTAGTVVGFPTAAFDWNTFSFYGVYVAYKDAGGAGSTDVFWKRNDDGTAAYSYSVPQTSGDLVGTPYWDTVNETVAGVDANGNGNTTDTDVRIVYLGTSLGHIIKLVDTGAGFARPASGPWASDFTGVTTITSALTGDGTNVYFGGTDGSGGANIFGVQIAGGSNEKTLQKTFASASPVTAMPSWSSSGGSTYVFAASAASSGHAYAYRINTSQNLVNGSFNGIASGVNDAAVLANNRDYVVTDGGTLHVLDAFNFGVGAFKNLSGFPYQTAAAQPIKMAPWVDYRTSNAYFGDDGGNLNAVTSAGASLAGYPLLISSGIKVTSTPMYLAGGGVIAVGANDGYLYFIDRRNASNVPVVFKRFYVTSGGSVSTVAYNYNTAAYLVASSDGKLVFINAADVTDPTSGTE